MNIVLTRLKDAGIVAAVAGALVLGFGARASADATPNPSPASFDALPAPAATDDGSTDGSAVQPDPSPSPEPDVEDPNVDHVWFEGAPDIVVNGVTMSIQAWGLVPLSDDPNIPAAPPVDTAPYVGPLDADGKPIPTSPPLPVIVTVVPNGSRALLEREFAGGRIR